MPRRSESPTPPWSLDRLVAALDALRTAENPAHRDLAQELGRAFCDLCTQVEGRPNGALALHVTEAMVHERTWAHHVGMGGR